MAHLPVSKAVFNTLMHVRHQLASMKMAIKGTRHAENKRLARNGSPTTFEKCRQNI